MLFGARKTGHAEVSWGNGAGLIISPKFKGEINLRYKRGEILLISTILHAQVQNAVKDSRHLQLIYKHVLSQIYLIARRNSH